MTDNVVYLNWYPFSPRKWKQGKQLFVIKDNFLIWVVEKILKKEKEKINSINNANESKHTVETNARCETKRKSHLLLLPYQAEKGFHLTKSLKRKLKSLLHRTVKANIGFTGKNSAYIFK